MTGDDFEFYRVTENPDHSLNYLGPVAEDSPMWAGARLSAAAREFQKAKIAAPQIFEFPHYAASAVDYQAVGQAFGARWERGMYFGGWLTGGQIDYSHVIGAGLPVRRPRRLRLDGPAGELRPVRARGVLRLQAAHGGRHPGGGRRSDGRA